MATEPLVLQLWPLILWLYNCMATEPPVCSGLSCHNVVQMHLFELTVMKLPYNCVSVCTKLLPLWSILKSDMYYSSLLVTLYLVSLHTCHIVPCITPYLSHCTLYHSIVVTSCLVSLSILVIVPCTLHVKCTNLSCNSNGCRQRWCNVIYTMIVLHHSVSD